jgi:enoyl-[acyl-carrier-protein] reductase (NADH)
LVTGAEKLEAEARHLKRYLRKSADNAKTGINSRMGISWRIAKSARTPAGTHLSPVIKRIQSLRKELEQEAEVLLQKTNTHARIIFTRMIDNTIVELEKVKQKLDQGSPRTAHAR